jgi:inosose dehydratase
MTVASAPVSFGVFELTAGGQTELPEPEWVLDRVADGGYEGIDLGPGGYLGSGAVLRERLERRGLGLAGGWIELSFLEPPRLENELHDLAGTLETFRAATWDRHPPPRPTLADAGSPRRRDRPGRAASAPELALTSDQWALLTDGVNRAARVCHEAGLEPSFHHHAGTHIESLEEIEQLLERTDVDLCLDTGHLLIGGGDPLKAVDAWRERINHVHVKDVDLSKLDELLTDKATLEAIWKAGVFREFGTGDADLAGFASALRATGYEGWVVVEQDRVLRPGESLEAVAEEQARNLGHLRQLGL